MDLIRTLPRGSLWRSARRPFGEWSEEREGAADVVDAIHRLIQLMATGSTEGAAVTPRPDVVERRAAARRRAASARKTIEETEWEEVE